MRADHGHQADRPRADQARAEQPQADQPRIDPARNLIDSGIDRRRFLRTAGAAALTGGALAGGALAGGALLGGTTASAAAPSKSIPKNVDVVTSKKVADLTGPGLTTRFGMEATDLGIPVRTPDGRVLWIFGDTFEKAYVGGDNWRSPVALYSTTTNPNDGVKWSGAVGGATAKQLWPYEHDNPVFSTVLPSDAIVIGDTIYLHAMVNKGLGNVVWTEIWKSDDNGENWIHTGAKFPPDTDNSLFQLLTWAPGDDGYVYMYATRFGRRDPIILKRVRATDITNPAAYQGWGLDAAGNWGWGNPTTPVLTGKFGEMCLRPMAGKWILTWFNETDYRIDGMVLNTPTDNLYNAYRRTLISGGDWGKEDDSHVAQLYGGYIIPGSQISDLHLSVSQWKTIDNCPAGEGKCPPGQPGGAGWPYRVMQFRISGFGL